MLSELFFYFKHRQASLIYGIGKKDYPNNMLTPTIDLKKNVKFYLYFFFLILLILKDD